MDHFRMCPLIRQTAAPLLLATPALAFAHVVSREAAVPRSFGWTFELWVVVLMMASVVLYMTGYWRLRARSQRGRTTRALQLSAFAVGSLALVIALNSPLDALSRALFSAHMVQHELLMIVAAPLLVLGRPLAVWLWAFPSGMRRSLGMVVRRRPCRVIWRWLTRPIFAWLFHAAALWIWHAPRFFEAALASPGIHTFQHTSFLLSALVFWWSVLGEPARPVRAADSENGSRGALAMLSLFTTMVHTGALGALLTLSPGVWYPAYIETASSLGFDPLQDQQLGGLVMWIPGGFAYLVAALVTGARWMVRRSPAPFAAVSVVRPVTHGAHAPQATRTQQDGSV